MSDDTEFILVRLDADEAGVIHRFRKLCLEKLGKRFQQDADFRRRMVDALLAGVEDIGK